MTSENPRQDIYDPKTIAVMDRAFRRHLETGTGG